MLALLAVEGEVCVCEFVAALEELQPGVSRHLGLLREGGWIVSRREGTWMHYRLARLLHKSGDPEAKRQLLQSLEEAPRFRDALRLLLQMNREGATPKPTASAANVLPEAPAIKP